MNITVTKWNVNNIVQLEDAQRILMRNRVQEVDVDWDDDPLKYEFVSVDNRDIDDTRSIQIDSMRYRYSIFKGKVERPVSKKKWYDENENLVDREERIKVIESTFLLYETQQGLALISIGAATTVRKVVNYMFKESEWGSITVSNFNIQEDLYYWLLYRLKDEENHDLSVDGNLKITGLLSYLGKTDDGSNAIRGNGRRVLSILGTLAYIFSSDSLKALRPEVQYNGKLFVIELTMNNSFKVYEDYCTGLNNLTDQEKIITLSIYTIEKVIPTILSSYRHSIRLNRWSTQIKSDFLKSIGEELIETINDRMGLLENEEVEEVSIENTLGDGLVMELEEDLLEGDLVT